MAISGDQVRKLRDGEHEHQAHAATATGHAMIVVTLAGAVLCAAALLSLPRRAARLATLPMPAGAVAVTGA